MSESTANWIKALWPIALAIVVAVGTMMLVQQQASANSAAIEKLDERKADKALVDAMLDQNRREHEDIKRLLGDIASSLRGRTR